MRDARQLWPVLVNQPVVQINEEDTINFGITPFRRAPVNARCTLKEGGYVLSHFLIFEITDSSPGKETV